MTMISNCHYDSIDKTCLGNKNQSEGLLYVWMVPNYETETKVTSLGTIIDGQN